MTTIPAPVGVPARAACAMKRVPSAETRRKSWDPAEPPAMGAIGGRESLSTHMGPPGVVVVRSLPGRPQPDGAASARRRQRPQLTERPAPRQGGGPGPIGFAVPPSRRRGSGILGRRDRPESRGSRRLTARSRRGGSHERSRVRSPGGGLARGGGRARVERHAGPRRRSRLLRRRRRGPVVVSRSLVLPVPLSRVLAAGRRGELAARLRAAGHPGAVPAAGLLVLLSERAGLLPVRDGVRERLAPGR